MSKLTQSQLVDNTVITYIREQGHNFESGVHNANDFLDRSDKTKIAAMLVEYAMANPSILPAGKAKTYTSKDDFTRHFRQYLSNNLRRSPALNGGTKRGDLVEEKKGPRDPQLKAMRQLLTKCTSDADKATIQGHIDARLAELKPKNEVSIDVNALPAELRHLAE
jgi:hypothetical protein